MLLVVCEIQRYSLTAINSTDSEFPQEASGVVWEYLQLVFVPVDKCAVNSKHFVQTQVDY